jgi:transcriptional regulator with PAS, ATPase and Fis domain
VLFSVGAGDTQDGMRRPRVVPVGESLTIGRRPTAGLVLLDRSVSGQHARVYLEGESYFLDDVGSTNGSSVDGRRVLRPTLLRDGAILFLGAQVLVFRLVTDAELRAIGADAENPFAPVATSSPALAMVCDRLRRFAPADSEVFLLGETGVGKEVFANAVHRVSHRPGPILAINCAALPRELVESELFGYEKGAHSAARERRTGLIAAADKGTLFLDELGEMPMESQSKLLRFLQDRQYFPIGSSRAHTADVRIIAASSRAALSGSTPAIQEALLGRLGAQPIVLPPLRHRVEDIGRLVAHFMGDDMKPFEPDAYHALFLHQWPHNVRELQKVIAEAQLLAQDRPSIGLEHLPEAVVATLQTGLVAREETITNTGTGAGNAEEAETTGGGEVDAPASATGSGKTRVRRPPPSAEELTALLQQYKGNVSHVAKHLDRQWAVIWRVLQRYGINPDDFRE